MRQSFLSCYAYKPASRFPMVDEERFGGDIDSNWKHSDSTGLALNTSKA
jgi:hypothetical protein